MRRAITGSGPRGVGLAAVLLLAPASAAGAADVTSADSGRVAGAATGRVPILVDSVVVRSAVPRDDPFARARVVRLGEGSLRAALGRTLAETLDGEPGIDQRTMGPAPARPVLRGLSGHRLAVLEDGAATGDLSATSADHAVTIEPLLAREVEVLRGPAALLHGSNPVGGVVDVKGGAIAERPLERSRGSLILQTERVNDGRAGGATLTAPLGPLVAHAEGTLRRGGDVRTPDGRLGNSSLATDEASVALSRAGERGFVGAAYGRYGSRYGIPGGFLGGHANGVDIDLARRRFDLRGGWDAAESGDARLTAVRGALATTRYYHEELEGDGACGVSFGVITTDAALSARGRIPGFSGRATFPLVAEHRDYANGCLSFTPPTIERAVGAVIHQSWSSARGGVELALRFDGRTITPAESDTNKAGAIVARSFRGVSAAAGGRRELDRGWSVAGHVLRFFRPPGVEELYSDGPHLAAYAYEVGNAALEPESGVAFDFGVGRTARTIDVRLQLFWNEFASYLIPTDTGELEYGAGSEGVLERWRYTGERARMLGGEAALTWRAARAVEIAAELSLVRGSNLGDGTPMPLVPPPTARVLVRHRPAERWRSTLGLRAAAAQERVAEFEETTAGWFTADASLQYDAIVGGVLHSVVLAAENMTDASYRRHLSRIKSVSTEPGFNLKLLYRLEF